MRDDLLIKILDRPIAFHAILADVTGSIVSAVMLSQALYWTRRTSDEDGWFHKSQDEWHEETRMSRYEQEGARKKLLQVVSPTGAQVWYEELRGLPAKMYYRLDVSALQECLGALDLQQKPLKKAANKYAEIPHTGMGKTSKLDRAIPADRNGENPQAFYIAESTSKTTSEIDDRDAADAALFLCWEEKLKEPLTAELREKLQKLRGEVGSDTLIRAILRAGEYGATGIGYVEKILESDQAALGRQQPKQRRKQYGFQVPEQVAPSYQPPSLALAGLEDDVDFPRPPKKEVVEEVPLPAPAPAEDLEPELAKARQAWDVVMGDLERQLPASSFDTFVRGCYVKEVVDDTLVIGLPNQQAKDWAENRLAFNLKRSLAPLWNRHVQLQFIVEEET